MSARRPIIGITCYVELVDRDPWQRQHSVALPYGYVDYVQRCGGIAVVLPPREDVDEAMAEQVAESIDGLIIAGGADVQASQYGAVPAAEAQPVRADRDAWELALVTQAHRIGLPILGICRGMQVMAVAAGATLIQHLPDVLDGSDVHSPMAGAYARHPSNTVPGTRLAQILGIDELSVPTYHHQSVDPKSLQDSGFVPAAWHPDGTLEGMEDPTAPFRLAVQWHPEAGEDPRLFEALLTAAATT